uniref:Citrate synthase n=1 Tax=Bos mutus grunniens TaxID=30521 RepID=A0A8B9W8V3_BOSMU
MHCTKPFSSFHWQPGGRRDENASCLVLAARHASASSTNLKDILADLIPKEQTRVKAFRQQHGKAVVGQITVDMVRAVGFCLEKELGTTLGQKHHPPH